MKKSEVDEGQFRLILQEKFQTHRGPQDVANTLGRRLGRIVDLPSPHEPSESPRDHNPNSSAQAFKELARLANENGATISTEGSERVSLSQVQYLEGVTDALHLLNWTAIFALGSTAGTILLQFKPFLLEWIKNREGRRVKVKRGEVEVEITGNDDIEKAVLILERLSEGTKSKKINRPAHQKRKSRS